MRPIQKIAVIGATGRLGAPVAIELAKTVFALTHFMELLPNMIRGQALQWIGNTKVKVYWISVTDHARVSVQGPEAITVRQTMKLFVANYDPGLKMRVAPLWVMRLVGLFNPRMRFVVHLFAYFGHHEDLFHADRTWRELGKPTTTLVEFAKTLRRNAMVAK